MMFQAKMEWLMDTSFIILVNEYYESRENK